MGTSFKKKKNANKNFQNSCNQRSPFSFFHSYFDSKPSLCVIEIPVMGAAEDPIPSGGIKTIPECPQSFKPTKFFSTVPWIFGANFSLSN